MTLDPGAPASTGTAEITAPADAVYALVTDLAVMAEVAEETTTMRWVSGSSATVGARFKGTNHHGRRRWTTTCTVTDAEPGRLFAFEVVSGPIPVSQWAYVIEPLGDDACRVTESTWDRRPGWFKRPGGWFTGIMDRNGANGDHIAATLVRLKARAESGS